MGVRPAVAVTLAAFLGVVAFCWPFLVGGKSRRHLCAPLIFGLLLALVLAVVLAEIADGGIDAKALAMLGVLSAIGAALQTAVGAGTAGIETVFFVLVTGRPGVRARLRFALGCTTLFASAIRRPVGSVALAALSDVRLCVRRHVCRDCCPSLAVERKSCCSASYGALSGYAFGLLVNLSFWPFSLDPGQFHRLPARACPSHRPGAPPPRLTTRRRLSVGIPVAPSRRSCASCPPVRPS